MIQLPMTSSYRVYTFLHSNPAQFGAFKLAVAMRFIIYGALYFTHKPASAPLVTVHATALTGFQEHL